MTERKPPGMSFTSWIDQQISEAEERGAFDDLPGAGKPLPNRPEDEDGLAWVRNWMRREGVSPAVMLPEPLKLRRESARLAETASGIWCQPQIFAAASATSASLRRSSSIVSRLPLEVEAKPHCGLRARSSSGT